MKYQQCKNCDHLFPLTDTCLLYKTTIDKIDECTKQCGLVRYPTTKDFGIGMLTKTDCLRKLKREK